MSQTIRPLTAIAGRLPVRQLSQAHVDAVTNGWKGKVSQATRYNRHHTLRKFLIAIQRGDLTVAKTPKPQPRTTIATPEELHRLLDTAPPWLKLFITIGATQGLRHGDILRLAPKHYDADRKILTITQQKTQSEVQLPVPPGLAATLEANTPPDPNTPYVFHVHCGPISQSGVIAAWQRAKRVAGVNVKLWIHDLRRTLAVSLYEVSKDLRIVEQALGHRSLATTTRYLEHRDPEKLRSLMNSLWTPKGPVQ